MKKFLTVALAGVLAASMLFTGCSKKEESKVPDVECQNGSVGKIMENLF